MNVKHRAIQEEEEKGFQFYRRRESVRDAGRSNYIIEKKHHQSLSYFFCLFFCVIMSYIILLTTPCDRRCPSSNSVRRFSLRSSVFGLRSSVFSYSRRCRRQHVGMQVAGSSRGTRYTPSPRSTGGFGVHTRSRFRRQDRRHSARTGQT